MTNYFIAVCVIKKDVNNEIEDIEFMNFEKKTEKISCLDDIRHLEDEIRNDLVQDGYIEDEREKWMYNITINNFQKFD